MLKNALSAGPAKSTEDAADTCFAAIWVDKAIAARFMVLLLPDKDTPYVEH
jgi:hypothetical protein